MSNVHGMVRSAYTFDPDVVSNETALDTGEDAVTQQCFKDECDINILLAKFAVTGQLPENVRVPQYVDFEEAFDFQSSLNDARQALVDLEAKHSQLGLNRAGVESKFYSEGALGELNPTLKTILDILKGNLLYW